MEDGGQENMKVQKRKMTKPQEGWSRDGDAAADDDDEMWI